MYLILSLSSINFSASSYLHTFLRPPPHLCQYLSLLVCLLTRTSVSVSPSLHSEETGYVGCLRNLHVNGDVVPLEKPGTKFNVTSSQASSGCSVETQCSSSLACPANSTCISQWKEGMCRCKRTWAPEGEMCVYPCDFQPCLNGGDCRPNFFDAECECALCRAFSLARQ